MIYYSDEDEGEKRPVISDEEKTMLRSEFLRTMQLKFLDGDPDYDYRYTYLCRPTCNVNLMNPTWH